MQVDGGSLAAPLSPTPPSILQSVDVPILGWTEGRTILSDISHTPPPWPDTCKGGIMTPADKKLDKDIKEGKIPKPIEDLPTELY